MQARFVSIPDQWIREHSVLWLAGAESAPLFSHFLLSHLKGARSAVPKQPLMTLDVESRSLSHIKATCEMLFLGNSQVIWLKGMSALSQTALLDLSAYLKTYQGPHTLICTADGKTFPVRKETVITLPQTVDKENYALLYKAVCPNETLDHSFVRGIFTHHASLPLDTAFVLAHYQRVIGQRHHIFMRHWLERVIPKRHSLFTLCTYFFAKNAKQFIPLWYESRTGYPDEFWVSYWSGQLWAASVFIAMKKQRVLQGAPIKGFRLPFSFERNDWRNYTNQELAAAHDFLYGVDFWHKNGSISRWVDLFCLKFVQNGFR